MIDLPTYLGKDPRHRHRCPFCKSKDGLRLTGATAEPCHSGAYAGRTGYYHCYACNASGDGLKYLMEAEDMTFKEALAAFDLTMARVDEGTRRRNRAERNERERLQQRIKDNCLRLARGETIVGKSEPEPIVGEATRQEHDFMLTLLPYLPGADVTSANEQRECYVKVTFGSKDLVRVTLEYMMETSRDEAAPTRYHGVAP